MIEQFRAQGFFPRACVWELTLRCNMRCLHCGSRAGQARDQELTLDELLRVAEELAELRNERTTLSGGEPLMREGWPILARRLTDLGVKVNMISNGSLFDERALEEAQKAGLKNVGISLDGTEEVHNHIRQRSDAYRRAMRAIDLCVREGFPVGVITHIINANRGQLRELAFLLLDRGVSRWQVQFGFDFGNLHDHPELLLEPASLKEIIPEVARLKTELQGRMIIDPADDMGYYTEEDLVLRGEPGEAESRFWMGCMAGVQAIGIEANGNIKGCLSMQDPAFVEGNVRDNSLREIWEREGAFAYTRNFSVEDLGGFCHTCRYNEICRGGCSWNSILHGREIGKRCNRYCLYQVYAEEGLADDGTLLLDGSECPPDGPAPLDQ